MKTANTMHMFQRKTKQITFEVSDLHAGKWNTKPRQKGIESVRVKGTARHTTHIQHVIYNTYLYIGHDVKNYIHQHTA